jgi:UDP-GlcNAc:undecaprenyl-phosphate GlcNAc-1-phosphate transferase
MINLIENNMNFLIQVFLIFSFNYLTINFFLTKLKINKLIDFPNEDRKIHKLPVSKIGGLVLFLNLPLFYFFFEFSINDLPLLIFLSFIFLIGFLDDLFNLNPYLRLLLITLFLFTFLLNEEGFLLNNVYFETFDRFKILGWMNTVFTIFCILAIINAFNLFDGLNGLSLSYFLMIFIYLLFKFNSVQVIPFILVCIILIYFNLKNKIFLGDSGVYFLSTYLGLKIIEIHNNTELVFSSENIFILLMIPGIDMFRVFFERIINNKMFLTADKKHLHHYLFNKFSSIKALLLFIVLFLVPIVIYEINLLPSYMIILFLIFVYSFILIYLKRDEQK